MERRPVLLPLPRRVEWGSGVVSIPAELVLVAPARQQELLPALLRFKQFVEARLGVAVSVSASAAGLRGAYVLVDAAGAADHPQGYRLEVGAGLIGIAASTAAGAAYGLATLKQLIAGAGRVLPAVSIEDHPDFGRRGVMLDISRGKVPRMETLFDLVDLMADMKINEFQLYTEHTFAYRDHKEVWQNYSPMTGEEILQLDRYCKERFVDLVPNQNSFGHMARWLVHDRYKHLAECVDGWDSPWGHHYTEPFTLCPLEPALNPFLGSLYDELLPHFSSPYFNVGCDETFDLGQGRSKEAVATLGEHRVYLDQLLKIYEMVKARGRTMQFWGDIIVKSPEHVAELPKDIIALEWGYEAEHPFDERCGIFAKSGIPFYVCPGTSTWNSLVGRTENALGNLRGAAEAGLKHGAIGYLNTIWGDHGHQDYQPVTYLPIAYGASVSWAYEANRDADVAPYLDLAVFGDRSGQIGRMMYGLGNIYKEVGITPPNGSALAYLFLLGFDRPQWGQLLSSADLDAVAEKVAAVTAGLDSMELSSPEGKLILRELQNARRLLLFLCGLAKLRVAQLSDTFTPNVEFVKSLALDLDRIAAEHRLLWLERNRIGGLEEMSMVPFRRWRQELDKLIG